MVRAIQLPRETMHARASAMLLAGAESPKPKKRCILRALKVHEGLKYKVVDLKKLVFQSAVCFLIRYIFDHTHCHLVDFKGERDPLKQKGLQGQN